jgi:hypothetical protein
MLCLHENLEEHCKTCKLIALWPLRKFLTKDLIRLIISYTESNKKLFTFSCYYFTGDVVDIWNNQNFYLCNDIPSDSDMITVEQYGFLTFNFIGTKQEFIGFCIGIQQVIYTPNYGDSSELKVDHPIMKELDTIPKNYKYEIRVYCISARYIDQNGNGNRDIKHYKYYVESLIEFLDGYILARFNTPDTEIYDDIDRILCFSRDGKKILEIPEFNIEKDNYWKYADQRLDDISSDIKVFKDGTEQELTFFPIGYQEDWTDNL